MANRAGGRMKGAASPEELQQQLEAIICDSAKTSAARCVVACMAYIEETKGGSTAGNAAAMKSINVDADRLSQAWTRGFNEPKPTAKEEVDPYDAQIKSMDAGEIIRKAANMRRGIADIRAAPDRILAPEIERKQTVAQKAPSQDVDTSAIIALSVRIRKLRAGEDPGPAPVKSLKLGSGSKAVGSNPADIFGAIKDSAINSGRKESTNVQAAAPPSQTLTSSQYGRVSPARKDVPEVQVLGSQAGATVGGGGGLPPWWVLNGVKPAGPDIDKGGWKAISFSMEQQDKFGVNEEGKIINQGRFDLAIGSLKYGQEPLRPSAAPTTGATRTAQPQLEAARVYAARNAELGRCLAEITADLQRACIISSSCKTSLRTNSSSPTRREGTPTSPATPGQR